MLEMIKGRGVDYVKKCMCHFVRLIVVILEMRGVDLCIGVDVPQGNSRI